MSRIKNSLPRRDADRVIKVALVTDVVNSDPDALIHGLERRHVMAFTLGYVVPQLALDLLNEVHDETILTNCESRLEEE